MRGLAVVGGSEQPLPPIEKLQRLAVCAWLIGQVVRPAAIRIDIAQMLIKAPRKEAADDGEVLVVRLSEPPAVRPGIIRRNRLHFRGGPKPRQLSRQVHPDSF